MFYLPPVEMKTNSTFIERKQFGRGGSLDQIKERLCNEQGRCSFEQILRKRAKQDFGHCWHPRLKSLCSSETFERFYRKWRKEHVTKASTIENTVIEKIKASIIENTAIEKIKATLIENNAIEKIKASTIKDNSFKKINGSKILDNAEEYKLYEKFTLKANELVKISIDENFVKTHLSDKTINLTLDATKGKALYCKSNCSSSTGLYELNENGRNLKISIDGSKGLLVIENLSNEDVKVTIHG